MAAKDVNVEFGEQILSVSIDVAGEDAYYFQPRLFGKIIPTKCRFDVLSTKVEIRLSKAEPLHWTSLEFSKDNSVPLRVSGPVVGVSSPDYPSPKPITTSYASPTKRKLVKHRPRWQQKLTFFPIENK
ncbi:hypothetical protein ACFX1X_002704 [Malus domestica]